MLNAMEEAGQDVSCLKVPAFAPITVIVDDAHCQQEAVDSFLKLLTRTRAAPRYNGAILDPRTERWKKVQLAGQLANKRKAERIGRVIDGLAEKMWRQRPHLKNKWLPTAKAIDAMKHDALTHKNRPDAFVGWETIRKHLSKSNKRERT